MITAIQILIASLIDAIFGEPRRYHPLVGFGYLALRVESWFNRYKASRGLLRLLGALAWLLLLAPFVLVAWWLGRLPEVGIIADCLLLYLALGTKSLTDHARAVALALKDDDLPLARRKVAMLVSRDTDKMDAGDISRATVESVLENGNDAIFAAIFWFAVLGAPGVVAYRLANTLDAMWGYRNARYEDFGWFAARVDDGLNWIPARLTAMSYLLVGHFRSGWWAWTTQARHWSGSNPGVVMASGAGALRIRIGGPDYYHGAYRQRPWLGRGPLPDYFGIERSIGLVQRSLLLWLLVIITVAWFVR